jgi:propionyl-CoA carboxylase alpha chain
MPSTGRLVKYSPPEGEGVRVDTGVYEGGEVSMFYDPMIAKLITYGDDRAQSITRMVDALDNYYIRGVNHNISFLNALMVHPRFVKGDLSTNFIDDEFPDGFNPDLVVQQDPAIVIVVAAAVHQLHCERASLLSDQMAGHEAPAPNHWTVAIADQQHAVEVDLTDTGYWVEYAEQDYEIISNWSIGEPLFKASINGVTVAVQVESTAVGYRLFYRGAEISARVITHTAAALMSHMLYKSPADMSKFLLSPMPGLLVKLSVKVGQEVKEGEELAVVEAMKMENGLRALQNGIVSKVSAVQGDSLAVDQIILEFE